MDKEKPGWDCTVRKPEGWERAKDVKHVDSPCIVADGAQYTDVKQGQIGDCFFIAALAAVAANRKSFLRQALVAYDEEVGVYGVMFCEEMHFVYEIVDDLFAVDEYKRLKFAKSANAKNEFWVSIIEKAYFKHVTCLEMCDGGWGPEAVFSLVDGVAGVYPVTDKEFRDPSRLWATVNSGLENGEIMTTSFTKPSKGKYAHLGDGEDGQCGETGIGLGLVEHHAYSTVRSGEVDGNQLICFRNPWASKDEWKGPWSDESEGWTDTRRAKMGLKKTLIRMTASFGWLLKTLFNSPAQSGSIGPLDPLGNAVLNMEVSARSRPLRLWQGTTTAPVKTMRLVSSVGKFLRSPKLPDHGCSEFTRKQGRRAISERKMWT